MVDELNQSIFPVVCHDSKGDIHVVGTAVLLECDGEACLVTAAHVLRTIERDFGIESAFLFVGETPAPIGRMVIISKQDSGLDIAVIPLCDNDELHQYLKRYMVIDLDLVAIDQSIEYNSEKHFVFGFPWRKAKYKRRQKVLYAKPMKYFTELVNEDYAYAQCGANRGQHVIVNYQRHKLINQAGRRVIGPLPQGISGGALFRALLDGENQLLMLIYDGMLIEFCENRYFVAVNVLTMRMLIKDAYSKLFVDMMTRPIESLPE